MAERDKPRTVIRRHAAVVAALGPLAGRRVLDAGCGTGRLLVSILEGGASAIGLDPPLHPSVRGRRR